MSNTKQYILKLFSGPHVGAEVLLRPGSYVIGQGEQCDIVLHDESLANEHLRLELTDTGIQIHPLAPTLLKGLPVTQSAVVLEEFQIITLGTTHLSIAPQGSRWEPILLPDLRITSPHSQANDLSAESTTQKAAVTNTASATTVSAASSAPNSSAPANPSVETAVAWEETDMLTAAPASETPPWPPNESNSHQSLWLSIGLVLIVLALGIIWVSGGQSPTPPAPTPADAIEKQRVVAQQTIDSLGMPNVNAVIVDNQVQIQGYVDTAEQKRQLFQALQPQPAERRSAPQTFNVWAADDIVAATRTTLNALNLPLETRYQQGGVVTISGDVPTAQQWQAAQEVLQRDVPGLKRIDAQINVKPELIAQTQPTTAASSRSTSASAPSPPAPSAVSPAVPTVPRLAIRSVNVSTVPYIVTHDGLKYLEGARLPNGFIIQTIQADHLILMRDNQLLTYYFFGERSS